MFAEVAPSSFSVAIVYPQCRGSGVLTMLWTALSSAFFWHDSVLHLRIEGGDCIYGDDESELFFIFESSLA